MNKVTGIYETLLVSFFVIGLRSDIRREISFSKPATLMDPFSLAQAYEARLAETRNELRPMFHGSTFRSPPTSPSTVPAPISDGPSPLQQHHPAPLQKVIPQQQRAAASAPPLLPTPNLPVGRLSMAELRVKRERGVCYSCDQKWSPYNHCQSKFLVLLGTD